LTQTSKRTVWPLLACLGFCLVGLLLWWLPVLPLVGALLAGLMTYVLLAYGAWPFAGVSLLLLAGFGGGAAAVYNLPFPVGMAFCLPSILCALLCGLLAKRRLPYFQLMQVLGVSALLLLLLDYGASALLLGDPIARLTERFRAALSALPPQAQTLFFSLTSGTGITSGQDLDFSKVLGQEQLARLLDEVAAYAELSYRLSLPSLFAGWALLCATLSTYLPLALLPSGTQEAVTQPPDLAAVRIKRSLNTWIMLAVAISWILSLFSRNGALLATSQALWELAFIAYAVQGVCVSEWFLRKRNMNPIGRTALIVLGVVLLKYALFVIGLLEQMLNFRGIEKRQLPGSNDRE